MKLRGNEACVGNELTEVNFVKAPKLLLLLISSVALGMFGVLGNDATHSSDLKQHKKLYREVSHPQ